MTELGHSAQSSPILKDITVNIERSSKVGICGRSGRQVSLSQDESFLMSYTVERAR